MTDTLLTIADAVAWKLGISSAARFPFERRYWAVNQGIRRVVGEAMPRCAEETVEVQLLDGASEYDVFEDVGERVIDVLLLWRDNTEDEVRQFARKIKRVELLRKFGDLSTSALTAPTHFCVYGSELLVMPAPQGDQLWNADILGYPDDLDTENATNAVTRLFPTAVLWAACAIAGDDFPGEEARVQTWEARAKREIDRIRVQEARLRSVDRPANHMPGYLSR